MTRGPETLHAVPGLVVSNFVVLGFGLANNVLIARVLGPAGRGELSTFGAVCSLGALIVGFGLPQAAQVLASARPNAARWLVVLSMAVAAIGAVVVACVLRWGGAAAVGLKGSTWWLLGAGMVGGTVAQTALGTIATGLGLFRLFNLATVVGASAVPFATAMLFLIGFREAAQVAWVAAAATVGVAIALAVRVWGLASYQGREAGQGSGVADVGPLAVRAGAFHLMWTALSKVDIVVLSGYAHAETVGIYAVAVTLADLAAIPGHQVNAVMRIGAAAGRVGTREAAAAMRISVLVGGMFVVAYLLLGRLVTVVAFGPEFAASWGYGVLAVGGAAAVGVVSPAIGFLQGQDRYPWSLTVRLAVAVWVLGGLAWGLVSSIGAWGAAVARLAGYLLLSVLFAWDGARRFGVGWAGLLLPRTSDAAGLVRLAGISRR